MNDNYSRRNFFHDSFIFKIYNFLQKMLAYQPQTYPDPFVLEETETSHTPPALNEQDATNATAKNSLKILNDNLDYAKDLSGILEDIISQLKNKQVDNSENKTENKLENKTENTPENKTENTPENKIKNKPENKTENNPENKTDVLQIKTSTAKLSQIKTNISKLSRKKEEFSLPLRAFDNSLKPLERTVSSSLAENKEILRKIYCSPQNTDIIFHSFEISGQPVLDAMLVFFDGMVDRKAIDLSILKPLIFAFDGQETTLSPKELPSYLLKKRLPSYIAKTTANYKDIAYAINIGDTVLFIDGAEDAIVLDTKGYEHRGVEKAQIEQSLQGTQASFTEVIQINTSLIRSIMPTNDLISESMTVGDRIETPCALMYLKSVANPRLVEEVKRRLRGIRTDYIINIGTLNQFIEEQPQLFFPKSLQTERPDRTALHLTEGRIAIFLHGAPFALIAPVNFFTFFHFVDDYALHPSLANSTRLLRVGGIFISMLLSSLYIALSYFHQEAIPTELALAIDVYREKVPFPIITELFAMEIAFEMIREAGLRVPGVLGSTITIVGAIIIGQAAVVANLVSPIVVVLVSLTALASFATPDYRMSAVFRITRFGFFAMAYFFGLEGIGIGLYLFILLLCHTKSFGVPYLVPWGPKTAGDFDALMRAPVFQKETRPDFLSPKDNVRQPHISREWALQKDAKGENQK